jgi:hypothetical protein
VSALRGKVTFPHLTDTVLGLLGSLVVRFVRPSLVERYLVPAFQEFDIFVGFLQQTKLLLELLDKVRLA